MRSGLLVLALALIIGACTTPPAGSPASSPQADLFEAEATYTGAVSMAGAYLSLPACGTATSPKVCKDSAAAAKIVLAVTASDQALATAETLILGCAVSQYVAATATPPTATCGMPVADETAQAQALTAVTTAISALQAAIPLIQSTGALGAP